MTEDCLFCSLKFCLTYFRVFGVYSHYYYVCQHTPYNNSIKMKLTKKTMLLSLIVALIMFATVITEIKQLSIQRNLDIHLWLRKIVDVLNLFSTATIIFLLINKRHVRAKCFIGLQTIINHSKDFGFEPVLLRKFQRTLKLLSFFVCHGFLGILILNVLYVFSTFENLLDISKSVLLLICFYINFGILFGIFLEIRLFYKLLKNSYYHMKKSLNKRKLYLTSSKFNVIHGEWCLFRITTSIRMTYAIKSHFDSVYKNFTNPMSLIWILTFNLIMILNIYIAIHIILVERLYSLALHFFILDFRVYMVIIMCVFVLLALDQLAKTVSLLKIY